MGREIRKLARQEKASIVPIGHGGWEELKASRIDVVVDFSSPAGLAAALKWCLQNGWLLVTKLN